MEYAYLAQRWGMNRKRELSVVMPSVRCMAVLQKYHTDRFDRKFPLSTTGAYYRSFAERIIAAGS